MEKPPKLKEYGLRHWLQWIIPVVLSILVSIITSFHGWIEDVYSINIYPFIAIVQRTLTGWIPFSLGDILYLSLAIWLLVKLVATIIAVFKRKITKHKTLRRGFKLARLLMWVYIIFNLVWGWNYYRKGPDVQLNLSVGTYSSSEVRRIMDEVVQRLNENRLLISKDTILPSKNFSELKAGTVKSYNNIAARFPFLSYTMPAIKKTMYSSFAQYMGFTGYYNPFSGEAQLRTHLPEIMKPFILCHEVGHQVGYAKEFEASFVGYLAAAASDDPYFRYSVYLDLYNSVRTKLVFTGFEEGDTSVIRTVLPEYNKKLDTLVRFDRMKIREYFTRNQTALSEQMSSVVMSMYEQYLKANDQAAGLKSYDDVVSLLIAYKRKFGRI